MKIAITSTGDSLNSTIDQRFGRCAFFAVYDTDSKSTEFIVNPNKDGQGGVGPASVQLIASKNVTKVISGEFGAKVKPLFDSLNIQMVLVHGQEKTISDIIEMFNQ
ncbi:MAG TPA: NifB/NifX family molybdenum-iron cluster-binding protein [Bacteroidales bacterium]|nr:NifB/NifX family molybdenum-iron cluster-binding protein [Bacteroidales bacterium]HQN16014.1 NifB/NifX family molybdenum-iron cluster-binding protein [Bacteroidales bacterium]